MNGFLLDTNVVSIFAPSQSARPPGFESWLERRDREGRIFLCVVAIHEIERGIALLRSKGATAKARALTGWLAGLVAAYADRILGLDAAAASMSGALEATALSAGHDPGMADAVVAGIAKAHDLVVVTFNVRHFKPFGVAALTPEAACDAPS